MKYFWNLCICIFFIFSSCHKGNLPENETREKEKWRIISLAPSTTKILEKLNLTQHLVATDKFSETEKKTINIGGFLDPNYELITEINPTHIIGLKSHSRIKEKLNFLNSKWILEKAENIEDYFHTFEKIGKEFGKKETAQKHINETKKTFNSFTEMASLKIQCDLTKPENCPERKKILIVISRKRGETTNILAASKKTFISEIIEMLGAENAVKYNEESVNPYWPNLSPESIIEINPDEIWEFGELRKDQELCCKIGSYFYPYLKMKTVNAVQEKSFKLFEDKNLTIPGPNIEETLKFFAIELYPSYQKEIENLIDPAESRP